MVTVCFSFWESVRGSETRTVTSRAGVASAQVPGGARTQLLEGTWDATGQLLGANDAIEATAARLPYVDGFSG